MKRSGAAAFFSEYCLGKHLSSNFGGKNYNPPQKNEGYFDLSNGKVNCHSHGVRFENSKFIMFIRNTRLHYMAYMVAVNQNFYSLYKTNILGIKLLEK